MKNRNKIIVRTSIIGIFGNIGLVIIKFIVGLIASSVSIIMDAVNNLSDALSSVITIVGTKLSQKKPDAEHPYGHGRIEYVTSLAIGIIILVAGGLAIYESIMSIINNQQPKFEIYSMILIAVAVLVKIALGLYFRHVGKKVNSEALKGSGVDALFDALLSFGTLVSIVVWLITDGAVVIEGYIGAVIGLFMIRSGVIVLKNSLSSIIGERTSKETSEAIKHLVCQNKDVLGAYDLIVNNYGPDRGIGSIHIEVDDKLTAKDIHPLTRNIANEIYQKFGIIMTIGIYASNSSDSNIAKIRDAIRKEISNHPTIKQMHGFYCNKKAKSISFDVIADFADKSASETIAEIKRNLRKQFPEYSFFVVEDKDFSD
ncbi:MAG: cation diffusion facilitator family transporter [Bacilli bacterium]|nr:cation diffusion facilitator family transporter [Bacilli bacterium]